MLSIPFYHEVFSYFIILFNVALKTIVRETQNKYGRFNIGRKCWILVYDIIILELNNQKIKIGINKY